MGVLQRLDSWWSVLSGLGQAPNLNSPSFGLNPLLSTAEIEQLLTQNDLAYRIVTALPNKALKDGFGFASIKDGEVKPGEAQEDLSDLVDACAEFDVRGKVLEADAWGRGYGLGGIILGISGAGQPREPLDDDSPQGQLDWLQVVDRRELVPESYYSDPTDKKFGEVELYRVNQSTFAGASLPVSLIHETRVIRFGGALTSRRDRQRNSGCDFSVLQRVIAVLAQADSNWAGLCALMADMSQGVYKINGLMDLIAAGNEPAMQKRMAFMDSVRSVSRSIILDAENEEFQRVATPMTGVNEVLEQTWTRLCAAAETPRTVLFGVSPAGMNATGESDMRLWYDTILVHREQVLRPAITRIARWIARGLDGAAPDSWTVTFPSLWQPTAAEEADYRAKIADSDTKYIAAGVLLPEEVALSRFASGPKFNAEQTEIDIDSRRKALKLSVDDITNPKPPAPMLPPAQPGEAPAAPEEESDAPNPR